MDFDLNVLTADLIPKGTSIGLKVLGALALWIIGGWVVGLAVRLVRKAMEVRRLDATIARYMESALTVLLKVVLVVAILGYFGLETTSFAAVLAAAGVAIGTAWSGLLSHYAAGIFMVVLQPFKVGDFVTAGGVTGTVEEVGLFSTTSTPWTTCGPSWAATRSSRTPSRTSRPTPAGAWSWWPSSATGMITARPSPC